MINKFKQYLNQIINPYPYRFYTRKRRCIFIHIPKAAGTSVLKAISYGMVDRDHAPSSDYFKADKEKFNLYFKFTFTRNPWDRAVSAYFYLLSGGNQSQADLKLSNLFKQQYNTFELFLANYLKEENLQNITMFRTQSSFVCDKSGKILMDFIGSYENLNSDFAYVCSRINLDNVRLPKVNVNNKGKKHYSSLYKSQELIDKIAFLYKSDIENFNYKFIDDN